MPKIVKIPLIILALLITGIVGTRLFLPEYIDKTTNKIWPHEPFTVPIEARTLHKDMLIMDWHADTLLWDRNALNRHDFGHVDLPRLNDGNIAVQMFTTVTKSPEGQNYEENSADSDRITALTIVQGWPTRTWNSLLERALYQAQKLDNLITASNGGLIWIKSKEDLQQFLISRHRSTSQVKPIGALLGTEGAHPLEGNIDNITRMYDAGFRMVGLTHFFDNELGGSLHGKNGLGLSDFGKQVIQQLDEKEIIIDLAHASEAMARDVLALSTRPVVISHTGLKGFCDSPRNYPDDLMKEIASKGGLIALGYWDGAVCDPSPQSIAGMIKYGIDLVGSDHIALGSDWDGSTESIAADDLAVITTELIALGIDPDDIRKIMGGNSIKFLSTWLPSK
ncbi:dipeptidase [Kordiimonas sp. SCSIO 12610]|uniref:dipeptidase n=1 Tax=Kordiimonas sp. SCSIO 12610 TaxID=2829597 RepID=UPI00210AF46B|nr:dipeptidase [Kordiimonas sp. SCSIO 12610]UTW56384.1 dipeptidase [Kordiimonas sp. SCSIO 12610]